MAALRCNAAARSGFLLAALHSVAERVNPRKARPPSPHGPRVLASAARSHLLAAAGRRAHDSQGSTRPRTPSLAIFSTLGDTARWLDKWERSCGSWRRRRAVRSFGQTGDRRDSGRHPPGTWRLRQPIEACPAISDHALDRLDAIEEKLAHLERAGERAQRRGRAPAEGAGSRSGAQPAAARQTRRRGIRPRPERHRPREAAALLDPAAHLHAIAAVLLAKYPFEEALLGANEAKVQDADEHR